MRFSYKLILAVAAIAVCLSVPSIAQAQGRGHGGGNAASEGRTIDGRIFGTNRERGSVKGPANRPHGWDQGKKRGWNGSALPPGLSKQRSGARTGTSNETRPVKIGSRTKGTSNSRGTDGRTLPESRVSAGGRTKK
jgi:hypothetical protein